MDNRRDAFTHKQLSVARLVTPKDTEAGARVVDASGRRGKRNIRIEDGWLQAQSLIGGFLQHPTKRHVGQAVIGITAPNIRMAPANQTCSSRSGWFPSFVPLSFASFHGIGWKVLRSSSRLSAWRAYCTLGNKESSRNFIAKPICHRLRKLVDRQAIGDDGIPHSEKVNIDAVAAAIGRIFLDRLVRARSRHQVPQGDQPVAEIPADYNPGYHCGERLPAIGAVRCESVAIELRFRFEGDQAL